MQEKPSWVTKIEESRRNKGQPTVSKEFSEKYDVKPATGSSGSSSGTTVSSGSSSGGYTPADSRGSAYHAENAGMTSTDQAKLKECGDNWVNAKTQEEKDYWHQQAEELRAQYSYSGGEDGSEYLPFEQKKPQQARPQISSGNTGSGSSGSGSKPGYNLTEYLNQQAAAQLESDLANLKYAFNTSMASYDAKAKQLPLTYNAARNSIAAQNALSQRAFQEYAAAAGLSSGAAGQAQLAQSSVYQGNIANLDQAQADALSQLELSRADLTREYENATAQAKSTGKANLANALYQELIRVQNLEREDAQLAEQMAFAREQFQWQQQLDKWNQEMDKWQQSITERELELKYSDILSGGSSSSGSSGGGTSGGGTSLTTAQIKAMQTYFGLDADGKWGPISQGTTGMTAEEAWEIYRSQSQYTGDQQPENTSLTRATFYEDEGVVLWNGNTYSSTRALRDAILAANLTEQERALLQKNLLDQGFVISL